MKFLQIHKTDEYGKSVLHGKNKMIFEKMKKKTKKHTSPSVQEIYRQARENGLKNQSGKLFSGLLFTVRKN